MSSTADGGVTAPHNLVLLCGAHHLMIHNSEWAVSITNGMPLLHPPPWQAAPPRSNPQHRPDLRRPDTPAVGRPVRVADLSGVGRR